MLRIKSKWHNSGFNDVEDKTIKECAGALAYIIWRQAKERANNLYAEFFHYKSHSQLITVMCEYLAYEIQISDRLAHELLENDAERSEFIHELARKTAEHLQDNARDFLGDADYKKGFIATLNKRSLEYSEYQLTEEGPSYPFSRQLGYYVQTIMGEEDQNRWVLDQVMDVDAPNFFKQIKKSMINLLA